MRPEISSPPMPDVPLLAQSQMPAVRDQLAEALRNGPFSRALQLAIEASGLSLDRLQQRLAQHGVQVSQTTLSYWRHGRSRPERQDSLRGVRVLEEVLGLHDGSLMALLGPRRPRGRWASRGAVSLDAEQLWSAPSRLTRLLEAMDVPRTRQLSRLSLQEIWVVSAEREERALRSREVVAARVDGVARTFVYYEADGLSWPRPEIVSTRYCQLGRVLTDPDTGLAVAEIILDRVLAAGETTILEYELTIRPGVPARCHERRFPQPSKEYVLQVHFDPAAVPARCFGYHKPTVDAPEQDVRELYVGSSNTVHMVTFDLAPGIHGIRLDWDDD